MVLLAEIDAAGWVMIITAAIGAVFTGMLQIVQMILSYYRARDAKIVGLSVDKAATKLDKIGDKVDTVSYTLTDTKTHINSMKDELVKATSGQASAEGKATGVQEERDRAALDSQKIIADAKEEARNLLDSARKEAEIVLATAKNLKQPID